MCHPMLVFSIIDSKVHEFVKCLVRRKFRNRIKIQHIENVGSENKADKKREKESTFSHSPLTLQLGYNNVPLRPTLSAFPRRVHGHIVCVAFVCSV